MAPSRWTKVLFYLAWINLAFLAFEALWNAVGTVLPT